MAIDETLNIDTPENVRFDYDIAGMGSRFIAALIDTTIIVILQVVANLLVILVLTYSSAASFVENLRSLESWVIALVGLISFLFLWGYYIFFEMLWNGQTPGKKLINLRVIRGDGTPITLAESIIRNLVRLVDFLPAFYGIGTVAVFINRQSRRLGDLAAGTLVIREKNQQISLQSLAALQPASQSRPASDAEQPQRTYPVERLDYHDIQMIESFILRQNELVYQGDLSQRLLKHMLAKMDLEDAAGSAASPAAALRQILGEYNQFRQEK